MILFSIPFIQFPSNWQVKFVPVRTDGNIRVRFLIKKDETENIVSVALIVAENPTSQFEQCWEVAIAEELLNDNWGITNDGEAIIDLEDVKSLLEMIEKTFTAKSVDHYLVEE